MTQAREIYSNSQLLKQLQFLMRDADSAILKVYHSENIERQEKGDNSPVTQADLAAHNVLIDGLQNLTPEIPVVSEEDESSFSIPKHHAVYWIIDPLDGTKEFINRNDQFTCNLALIENNTVSLGFVSVPALNELYFGGKNLGATLVTSTGTEQTIKHISKPGVIRVIASKSHLNEDTQAFIEQLKGKVELIQAGSSLKFIKIATGEADLYPRLAPTCEWDTAAAQAILEGSGGKVLQVKNLQPIQYGKDEILNPYFIASAY